MGLVVLPLTFLFALVMLQLELIGRRSRGVEPASWRAIWKILSKKTTPNPEWTAFAFALSTTFFIAFWEGMLRAGLDRAGPEWRLGVALLLLVVALALRRSNLDRLYREDLFLFMLAFHVALGATGTIILWPWVLFRARFLPSRWSR